MTKPNHVFGIILLTFLTILSCSEDEDEKPIVPLVFNGITNTDNINFIDEPITVTIDGSGFTEIDIRGNKSEIVVTEVATKVYEVTATKATQGKVFVTLKNDVNEFSDTKNIDVTFAEHGVKNYNIVEGLLLETDTTVKMISLLGEPEAIAESTTDTDFEFYYYFTKGLWFYVNKLTKKVIHARLYADYSWVRAVDNIDYRGDNYPYEIGNSLTLENPVSSIGDVVAALGEPNDKIASAESATQRWYRFDNQRVIFYFFANSFDEAEVNPKPISYVSVFK